MKEEHAIAILIVGAVAFMIGWQLCAKRAQPGAPASGQGADGQAETPELPYPNQTEWLKSYGGLGGSP